MSTIEKAAAPAVPISKALVSNGFLFISGQIGSAGGQLVSTSFQDEVRQVFTNIEAILNEHNLTFSHIVSVTVYLTDMRYFDELNAVYQNYFVDRFPTRTCIAVAGLPKQARVELTTTASLELTTS
ncbi:2-iminobutanoate/2-iminopropanoate deaminase [Dyadobacter sp. SG02]|uniref:RidA family protein n=1 Tax=Dyadobacter sp. SG02 TaxID=1855291 RepID=UPI0008C1C6E0|nr:Rid family detoxifying hydrolase [Dyadobacter sp. SG02]SEJ79988.1 2-iminobutanoate/2-iminopropanoate deaminase [Dyadobacter sp. SG02]